MNSTLIVFLDGVGLGEADPGVNPFMHARMPFLHTLLGVPHLAANTAGAMTRQAALLAVDAGLGVEGLPQSATGQTAILTGHNAPALLGEHFGPYPSQPLRQLLAEQSLFARLTRQNRPVAYANAYPRRFLDRIERGKGRLSANTLAAHMAGLPLRGLPELRRGEAISALFTNEFWPEPNVSLPLLPVREAGQKLARLAMRHQLTFFEFWYSDYLGHKMEREESVRILERLDGFLAGVCDTLDFSRSLLLVISDHGNLEDWTTKKHTPHPALGLLVGQPVEPMAARLQSLTDVAPLIVDYLDGADSPPVLPRER
ncbi:MAG: metalloenzyme [Anaerolineae bacterium]